MRQPIPLDPAGDEDARLIEHKERSHDGEGRDDGVGYGRDYFGKDEEEEMGDAPLFLKVDAEREAQPDQDDEDAGKLEGDPAGEEEEEDKREVVARRGHELDLGRKEAADTLTIPERR